MGYMRAATCMQKKCQPSHGGSTRLAKLATLHKRLEAIFEVCMASHAVHAPSSAWNLSLGRPSEATFSNPRYIIPEPSSPRDVRGDMRSKTDESPGGVADRVSQGDGKGFWGAGTSKGVVRLLPEFCLLGSCPCNRQQNIETAVSLSFGDQCLCWVPIFIPHTVLQQQKKTITRRLFVRA